jgi:hypothetical protein
VGEWLAAEKSANSCQQAKKLNMEPLNSASLGFGGFLPLRFDVLLILMEKTLKVTAVRTLSNPLRQTFLCPVTLSTFYAVASVPGRIL